MPLNNRFNFTKSTLDSLSLPQPGKRAEYHDAKVPGLRCRHTSNGTKTFSVVVWHRTRQKPLRETLGTYPTLGIEQARQEARKRLGLLAQGVDLAEERRKAKQRVTFTGMFSDYYEQHALPKKRTAKEDLANFDRYLRHALGPRLASEITKGDVASVHASITRGGAAIAANRVVALISSVFGWAMDRGLAEANPAQRVRKNKERSRDRYIRPSELPDFFRAVQLEPNPVIRDFVLLCLYTGQRRSNVLAMRWEEIDFHKAEWHIPRRRTARRISCRSPLPRWRFWRNAPCSERASSYFPAPAHRSTLRNPRLDGRAFSGAWRALQRCDLFASGPCCRLRTRPRGSNG
jgi:integrase